ncbi:hypothetical protein ERO13_D03G062301v2 [Gossypium hirsutum]|uniref:Uncharacterized protein n=3 Tax=Gossypium TaxID=3633 RepID=A0A0D2TYW1_GOSRA|nr:hypothetical protein ES319_D03G075000v1 [Gossypium barbadense]KAG4154653.1 hypothetical protein ERO13_D03G062301v2 [Gossypium hirsutum]KJB80553.1 hypothetical protein B456_013G107200 [Gossypium raimondii]TYI89769.1 hypothetical protein E1A91_D03G077800v1 [Gossypium mustelinum]
MGQAVFCLHRRQQQPTVVPPLPKNDPPSLLNHPEPLHAQPCFPISRRRCSDKPQIALKIPSPPRLMH